MRLSYENITVQKIKLFITDLFSKCDRIRSLLRIWSHLVSKSVMGNFIFCAVYGNQVATVVSFMMLDLLQNIFCSFFSFNFFHKCLYWKWFSFSILWSYMLLFTSLLSKWYNLNKTIRLFLNFLLHQFPLKNLFSMYSPFLK